MKKIQEILIQSVNKTCVFYILRHGKIEPRKTCKFLQIYIGKKNLKTYLTQHPIMTNRRAGKKRRPSGKKRPPIRILFTSIPGNVVTDQLLDIALPVREPIQPGDNIGVSF